MKSLSTHSYQFLAIVLLGLSALFLGGCVEDLDITCVEGTGDLASEERALAPFQGIVLQGSMDVYLSQGAKQRVVVEAQGNLLEQIETVVQSDTMTIKTRDCVSTDRSMIVHVTIPAVSALVVEGSGDILGQTPVEAGDLTLDVVGSGDIELDLEVTGLRTTIEGSGDISLTGSAASNTVSIVGSGSVAAFDLVTGAYDITIEGSGDAQVHAVDELMVNIEGSGSVTYRGDPPTTAFDVQGSGTVDRD